MSTEARLERLEQELVVVKRRFRRLAVLGTVLGAAAVTLAWTGGEGVVGPAQEVVRAQRFVLEDVDGTVRGVWNSSEEVTGIGLYDQNEQIRVSLASSATGPQLHLVDDSGIRRVQLAVSETGSALYLYDESNQIRTQIGVGGSKTSDGRTTAYPESSIRLAGPDGELIWVAP